MTLTPTSQNAAVISVEVGKVPSLNSFYASKHWIIRKFGMDAFKDWGGIVDDSKKYFPKLTIIHNPDLERNTSKLFFTGDLVD